MLSFSLSDGVVGVFSFSKETLLLLPPLKLPLNKTNYIKEIKIYFKKMYKRKLQRKMQRLNRAVAVIIKQ